MKRELLTKNSRGKLLYLKAALAFVFLLTLGCSAYIALFMPASQELRPVDINLFSTGEWNQLYPFEPYYDGHTPIKTWILKDSTGEKYFRMRAHNDSASFSGVAFHIDRPVPSDAGVSFKWRGAGRSSLVMIDVMDGSVAGTSGRGDSMFVLGETFFTEKAAPGKNWSNFSSLLDALVLNPFQPSGKTVDGVFDYNSVRQVSISISPNSDFTLDIKDLHFFWNTKKWTITAALFLLSLAGLLLLIRTKPERLFSGSDNAYNVNSLVPRIVFCLAGLSAVTLALSHVMFFADTANLAFYGATLALIVTEEFLVFLKPNALWSMRYAVVLFAGYFIGFSGGIVSFSLMLLASCMPLITERIKAIFWTVILLAAAVYVIKPLPDSFFSFLPGLIILAVSGAAAVIMREYLQQQHRDFKLGQAILQYEALFKKTSDAIYVLNENAEISAVNQSFERLTGYNFNQLKGRSILRFVCPESEITVKSMLENMNENDSMQYDIHFAHSSGQTRTALVRCSAIYYDKHVTGYQALATDITERKIAEEKLASTVLLLENKAIELAHLNEQLRELNISKDKFFSIISHDLKNPFNSILGFSDLLYKDIDFMEKEDIRAFAGNINGGMRKIYNLLNNLLQWASIQSGKMKYEPGIIRLFEMTEDAIDVLSGAAEAKDIKIINSVEKKILVFADLHSVNSVIRNLVTNAIKFSNAGGIVEISSSTTDEMAALTVSDSGIGMKKEDMEKLFRIDVQHTTSGTAKETGSGLGLILCKEMIEKNGGSISVESEPGKGSHFTFTLPMFQTRIAEQPMENIV